MRPKASTLLGLILLGAFALRCINIGFGLPAMYDPDEPLFILKAYELLDHGTLNPGWFGHPGSTTIYLLAVVDVLVVLTGMATGAYSSVPQFAAAVYADPAVLFVPSRFAFVLIGVAVVWLTYLVARRLFDAPTALLAAAFLALNALHIAWSQVIRTDIHASLFMLASLLFAIRAAESGGLRDLVIAGLFAGVATATKWPGVTILVSSLGAIAYRSLGAFRARDVAVQLGVLFGAALAGLFVASPFILLDWRTVIDNVSGEVAGGHLGHSGRGLAGNLAYYLGDELVRSMGWAGLILACAGLVLLSLRPVARVTLLPATLLFLWLISAQSQIWSRWLTPALPMLAIAAALATTSLVRWLTTGSPARRPVVLALAGAAVLAPSVAGAIGGARERANDTRDQASAWARANIPRGSTIVVEHLALDLRGHGWRILFPLGAAGCIDGERALASGVRYDSVQKSRAGSPIVDIGHVPATRLPSCRADFGIFTYYDLYRDEAAVYTAELDNYRRLAGSGKTVAIFYPLNGRSGGPVTRIVALGQQSSPNR